MCTPLQCKKLVIWAKMSGRWYGIMVLDSLSHKPTFFIIEDVCIRPKKSATHKAKYLQGIKPKILKWIRKKAHVWMCNTFNCALEHHMPDNWS